jgi:hypothetical protein
VAIPNIGDHAFDVIWACLGLERVSVIGCDTNVHQDQDNYFEAQDVGLR